jgi:hypothetical protein
MALSFVAVVTSGAVSAEPIEIPLMDILAHEMPGTLDIRQLTKRIDANMLDATFEHMYARAERLQFKGLARPGFAVSGSGLSAFRAAHAVLTGNEKAKNEFLSRNETTIVFFSEPISRYGVQIRTITRKVETVEICYELVPDLSHGSHVNFALIPIGKLPAGNYHVGMRQLPRKMNKIETRLGFKPINEEWSRNFLCKPFDFIVRDSR